MGTLLSGHTQALAKGGGMTRSGLVHIPGSSGHGLFLVPDTPLYDGWWLFIMLLVLVQAVTVPLEAAFRRETA